MMRVRNQVTGDEDEDGDRLENFQQVVPKEYFEEGFCPINAPVVEQALQNDGKGVTRYGKELTIVFAVVHVSCAFLSSRFPY